MRRNFIHDDVDLCNKPKKPQAQDLSSLFKPKAENDPVAILSRYSDVYCPNDLPTKSSKAIHFLRSLKHTPSCPQNVRVSARWLSKLISDSDEGSEKLLYISFIAGEFFKHLASLNLYKSEFHGGKEIESFLEAPKTSTIEESNLNATQNLSIARSYYSVAQLRDKICLDEVCCDFTYAKTLLGSDDIKKRICHHQAKKWLASAMKETDFDLLSWLYFVRNSQNADPLYNYIASIIPDEPVKNAALIVNEFPEFAVRLLTLGKTVVLAHLEEKVCQN